MDGRRLLRAIFCLVHIRDGDDVLGPFAWLSDPERPNLDKALRGDRIDLAAFEAKNAVAAIAETQATLRVKELEFLSFDGQPFYLVREAPTKSLLVSMRNGCQPAFGSDQLLNSIKRAVAPASVIAWRRLRIKLFRAPRRQNEFASEQILDTGALS